MPPPCAVTVGVHCNAEGAFFGRATRTSTTPVAASAPPAMNATVDTSAKVPAEFMSLAAAGFVLAWQFEGTHSDLAWLAFELASPPKMLPATRPAMPAPPVTKPAVRSPFVLFGASAPSPADVISIHIYNASFINWNFGEGSAMSVLMLIFLLLVTAAYLIGTSRRRNNA